MYSVPVRLTVLGSGSAGNSAFVESGDTRLLIDAGLSVRQIRERLAKIGRTPELLSGVLITHEHTDHVKGLIGLADRLGIPVYCNRATKEAIEFERPSRFDWRIFTTGEPFEINNIGIETFALSHDAQDPVGFVLHTDSGRIGFVTDLGYATKLVIAHARTVNVLVLETNHDLRMLRDCPNRPWRLKQRIMSRYGHLSNDAAADALEQIVTAELRYVFLAHLSRECNRPELAYNVIQSKLHQIGANHVSVQLTSQTVPSSSLELVSSQNATSFSQLNLTHKIVPEQLL